jgi:hypothetical protein
MLYTVVESNINYGCEIWTADYRLKKYLLSPETDFWKGDAKETSKIIKIKNELEKNWSNTIWERMGSSLLNGTAMYYLWEVHSFIQYSV